MNFYIAILLVLLAFVAGFLVGGKWKKWLFSQVVAAGLSAKAKLEAIRKRL